jgi:protease I
MFTADRCMGCTHLGKVPRYRPLAQLGTFCCDEVLINSGVKQDEKDQGATMPEIAQAKISQASILIMASSGFEQSELQAPLRELRNRGATVHVAAPDRAPVRGRKERAWGISITPDKAFDAVNPSDYDALVLPGGALNPDSLRWNQKALQLIAEFVNAEKIVATICHAPWLLVEIGALRGRKVTCFKSIKTEMINAGAQWQDSAVVVDRGFITGRSTADLPAFIDKLIDELQTVMLERELRAAKLDEASLTSKHLYAPLVTPSRQATLKQFMWQVFAKYADRYRPDRYRLARTVDAPAR